MAEPLSNGADGQFLGERRRLTVRENTEAVEAFLAKSPSLSLDEQNLVRSTWSACVAFHRVADYEGFEEAMSTLRQEVPVTS